jgi:hypothetical protein
MEPLEARFRTRYGERGDALLDLAGWEPVNINVFASLSRLGNPKPPLKSRIAA